MTIQMEASAATLTVPRQRYVADSEFDLDISLVEVLDPGHLINMTDDNCGSTCEKSTCVSAA